MKHTNYIRALLLSVLAIPLFAQQPAITVVLESNNVRAACSNNGALFNNNGEGAFIPVQPGLAQKSLLKGSGLWLGGFDPAGNFKSTIVLNDQSDFQPGLWPRQPVLDYDPLLDIWQVSCSDIQQHLADYQDNGIINNPNGRVFNYPSKGNRYFADLNNNLELPSSQLPLAGYFDRTEDATYDPERGEYPVLELRGCPMTQYPTEQTWFVSNDSTVHTLGTNRISVEVQTQIFTYKTASPSLLNNTVFVRYLIPNFATERLDSCYFGLFTDFDIGHAGDDFVGSIPEQYLMYGYNGDNNDEGNFNANIPVMAIDVLRGPLDSAGSELPLQHMMVFDNADNLQPLDYYKLLSGTLPNGTSAPNGGIMYPDNPNIAGGNSEYAQGNTPGERAGLFSFGPFTLLPGATSEFIVAYYYVHTPGATPLENVATLYQQAEQVQEAFDNCFDIPDVVCNSNSAVATHELSAPTDWSAYPNPATTTVTITCEKQSFSRIELTDVLGRVAGNWTLGTGVQQHELDTNGLPNGLYLLRVDGTTRPWVIQR
jgi:Secretion system C-terminal sorting domain